jgi:hypothetical protein
MGKQYQTSAVEASTLGLTIPEEVSVALAEIAESFQSSSICRRFNDSRVR